MMLAYALQVILFQLAFLLVYELLLKKETFFSYNRWYLLFTPSLALLLPILKFDFLSRAVPTENIESFRNVWLPEVVIGGNQEVLQTATETAGQYTMDWWSILYIVGIIISSLVLIIKFRKLLILTGKATVTNQGDLKIYTVENSNIACTFFNRLFIGDLISEDQKEQILAHEMVHIRERHSLDLIFFEILKIVFWFNPLIYIFQKRLATVHEFIADETAVKVSGKRNYYEQLLNSAFGTENISFINQFFSHSLIKKRIIMLQKHKSSTLSKFKFLLVIPLMLAMLTYVACSENNIQDQEASLSQYSYSISKQEGMTTEDQAVHKKYEEFLIDNPDYVSWATIDYDSEEVKYSVHPADEEVPLGYDKLEVSSKDGRSYTMYMNLREKGTKENPEIIEVVENKSQNPGDVPFAVVDEVPVFPGCANLSSNEEQKKCMSEKISQFVNKTFDTSLGKKLGLSGMNRVIVQFKINQNGNVVEARARAAKPELEAEAIRVVNSLPQMQPGKQRGRDVSVMYSLPIAFKVQ